MKISLKYKIYAVLFIVFFIFNSDAALNYTEIKKNLKKSTLVLTASIVTDDEELCFGEETTITFEGSEGAPNYIFTYTINAGSELEISTTGSENAVSLNFSPTSSGTYTYTLVKVEDSDGTIEDVDEEIVITVTSPPSISFTFTNDGACSNETIDFTSSVSGDGPFSYTWNFGDGNTSTDENPSHTYNTTGIGLQNFSVTLSVTDDNTCTTSVSEMVGVQNIPNISFFSGGSLKNCAAQGDGFDVEFFNSSQSSSDITSYTFDWGDGSSETLIGADFPANANGISHTFEIGVFTVVISAINSSGCSNEVEFEVIYGNDPGGGLQSPPNTSGICYPTEQLDFGIVGWGENSEETIYELDFGDGTIESYTQVELESSPSYDATDPSMSSIFLTPHVYNSGSCSEVNGEFIVKLTITNACNNKISTANNVVVLEPSVPLFEVDPIGCVNVPLQFDNQSIIGDNVDCIESARFSWDWGDGNVQNFPPGSTADDQSHTYTQPGNYTVILSVIGDCPTDTYSETICIEPEITASFTLASEEGCVPFPVAAQNTIDVSQLCSVPNYNWTVAFEDINCNTLSDWEFTNGTDANSENPQFLFNNPGIYTVTQNVTTGCGNFSSQKIITVKKPPTISINPIDDFCQPGLINPTAIIENCTDNQAGVSYNWMFPGGTPSSSSLENPENISYDIPGIYTITLEVTNDCGTSNTATQIFEVLEKPVVTNLITTQEICSNQSTISIPLTSSNSNTTYLWTATTVPINTDISGFISSGSTSEIPSQTLINSGNTPGNVVFTVTPVLNNCVGESVEVLTVIVNPTPIITSQPASSDICLDGVATQLAVVTQNGVGVPTYQWYSNTTNNNTTGTLIPGATTSTYDPPTNIVGVFYYYVLISFDGGCDLISSDVAIVTIAQEPEAVVNNPIQLICLDGSPLDFEITLTGGVGAPSYQWYSNTTALNTGGSLISGATASTYNPGVLSTVSTFYYYVEATQNGVGCDIAVSDVFTVEVVADPVIDSQAIATQEICQNASLQDLIITVSGGIASSNFDYQWYSNTNNSNSGGAPIAGANTNTLTPDNTTEGTLYYYVVVMQSESGCEVVSNTSEVIITPGPIITSQPASSDICLDGVATQLAVVTQNGVGVPTYQWYSNTTNNNTTGTLIPGATTSTYDPPTNIVGVFYYYVLISFDGGCDLISSEVASVVVNEIPVIDTAEITIYSEETFLFDPSSVAGNIVPTGNTYTWPSPTSSNPGTILGSSSESSPQTNISQTLENISSPPEPVTETYVITPATPRCSGDPFILKVIVNPSIISNALITNNSCFDSNDGVIDTDITGGVPFSSGPPYLISWTGPNSFTSTASTITNLLAGDYTLRVEDSNGVFVIEQYTVSQPDLLTITTDVEKNISCFDGNDGTIEVNIIGGTAPYTYNWTGDGVVQGSPSQSGLTAGTYSLEVVDDKLCVINQTYILTEPDIIVINTVSKNDILCFGDATGAIEINVTGGIPIEVSSGIFDYVYNWNGPNGFTSNSQNISNLFAGIYTIEITDDLGCIQQTDIELTQPTAIEINYIKTDVTCYGAADGSIDVTVNGGEPPYQISWSNFGNGFSQSNLSAGNYIASIVDQNLCEANVTITIEQPIFFIAPIVSQISCNDANDASIDLNLTGGIAPITVLWSDDPSAGVQRNNLSSGSYTVIIIDSDTNQCPIEETFIITNPPELAVTSVVNDAIDCHVTNSGSIELDVSGGTLPYTFLWNTGQTLEDIFNIPSGDYSVEIKDSRGCIINREYTIFRQEPIIISMEETVIPDCNSNTINVQNIPNVTGGFLPYTYSWSSGVISGSNNEIMTTNQSGAYVLTVTDGRGCQESVSIQVDVPEVGFPEFTYESLSLSQYSFVSIEDSIQFFNLSTGNFINISWDFGDGSPTVNTVDAVHTYDQVGTFTVTLTVEYDYGCTYQITQDINVTKGYLLVIPNAFSPNEDGINDVVRPSFRGFTTIRMLVYDTWGTLVYEEEGTSLEGWNGFINEKPAENGNYIMYVNGITFFGQEIKKSTSITLLK